MKIIFLIVAIIFSIFSKIKNPNPIICSSTQHLEGKVCVDNIKSCLIENGAGTQSWNGSGYDQCQVKNCNLGFHIENNQCLSDIKSCEVLNGVGEQIWNSQALSYQDCIVKSCNLDFHIEDNSCVSNVRACSIENGIGSQTWDGSSYNNCIALSCEQGFQLINNQCIQENINEYTHKFTASGIDLNSTELIGFLRIADPGFNDYILRYGIDAPTFFNNKYTLNEASWSGSKIVGGTIQYPILIRFINKLTIKGLSAGELIIQGEPNGQVIKYLELPSDQNLDLIIEVDPVVSPTRTSSLTLEVPDSGNFSGTILRGDLGNSLFALEAGELFTTPETSRLFQHRDTFPHFLGVFTYNMACFEIDLNGQITKYNTSTSIGFSDNVYITLPIGLDLDIKMRKPLTCD